MATEQNDNLSHPRKPVAGPMLVTTLAEAMGLHPVSLLRDLKQRGYKTDQRRTASGQMASVISADDAARYRAERAAERLAAPEGTERPERQVAEILTQMRQKIDQVFETGAREIAALLKDAEA